MVKIFLFFLLICFAAAASAETTMRDPTKPPDYNDPNVVVGIGKDGLVVSAIIYSKQRKVALVNGEFHQAGDEVAGFKIIEINPNAVRFKGEEGEFDVPLVKREVKTAIKQR